MKTEYTTPPPLLRKSLRPTNHFPPRTNSLSSSSNAPATNDRVSLSAKGIELSMTKGDVKSVGHLSERVLKVQSYENDTFSIDNAKLTPLSVDPSKEDYIKESEWVERPLTKDPNPIELPPWTDAPPGSDENKLTELLKALGKIKGGLFGP